MSNKKTLWFLIVFSVILWPLSFSQAIGKPKSKLSGRILLQVESKGEAWYINPTDNRKYSLGRPAEAMEVMKKLGLGISEKDFESLKNTTSTDKLKKMSGRILLRVQKNGEAWYINPIDLSLNYLGRPNDAFNLMRKIGLGVKNVDLEGIEGGGIASQELEKKDYLSFDLDFSKYELYKNGKYDFISLKKSETDNIKILYNEDENEPRLPIVDFEKNFSVNAKIEKVEVVFSDKVDLGKLNIPAMEPIDEMAHTVTGGPIDCPKIGIWPKEQYDSLWKQINQDIWLRVSMYPIVHNTETGETTLYKKAKIKVYGKNLSDVRYTGGSTDKDVYGAGEDITFNAGVFNDYPGEEKDIFVKFEIETSTGKIVWEKSFKKTLVLDSRGKAEVIEAKTKADFPAGNYTARFYAYSGSDEKTPLIGANFQFIRVVNGEITKVEIPEKVKLEEATFFKIFVKNLSAKKNTAFIDCYIIDSNRESIKLPQMKYELATGETKEIKTSWIPTEGKYAPGEYRVLVATDVDNDKDTEYSNYFTISK